MRQADVTGVLDAAVNAAYGGKGFKSEADRDAFLFGLYKRFTSLLPAEPGSKPRRSRSVDSKT